MAGAAAHPGHTSTTRRRALLSRRGVSTVEFAIVAMPFLTMVFGIMEISWQLTTAATLDHSVLRAARFGITGQARQSGEPASITCRSQSIPWVITNSTGNFLRPDRLTVTTSSVAGISGLGGTSTAGAGTGGQVVTYTVTYRQPILVGPLLETIFGTDHLNHTATIVVKNEPFSDAIC